MAVRLLDDKGLAEALRTGRPDQLRAAFSRHIAAMALLARSLCDGSNGAAISVITAAWTSVTADFRRDVPRGSARAWLFARLARLDPVVRPDAWEADPDGVEFLPADDPWEGHWVNFPVPWRAAPDPWETSAAGHAEIEAAVAALPLGERIVLVLRDLDGWSAAEVGALTGLSPEAEREVLLHARLRIRDVMDAALRAEPSGIPADRMSSAADPAGTSRRQPAAMADPSDLTCQVSVALLPKYLDDDLPEPQTVRLEQHVAICPGCATYLAQLRRTIAGVSGLPAGVPAEQIWAGIAASLPTPAAGTAALDVPAPHAPATAGSPAEGSPAEGSSAASTAAAVSGRAVAGPGPGPGPGHHVVAYKFLASDRTARFSQLRWPWPAADGDWVSGAAAGTCRRGVHACRPRDLAYWLDQALWRVELAGPVTESTTKIVAERGRLLAPVVGWPEVLPTFIDDCLTRFAELRDWAREQRDHRATRMLRGYGEELAGDSDPASVSYTVAHAAGIVGWLPGEGMAAKERGERSPFDAERRRQGRWLGARLDLPD
jgi:RNA polymerase sigma-70 factor (ECF subfamily)